PPDHGVGAGGDPDRGGARGDAGLRARAPLSGSESPMRISLTPRAALIAVLALPLIVLWPTWWMLLASLSLWALTVLVDAFLAPAPTAITVARDAPGQVRLGTEVTGRLLLTNTTSRPALLEVRDAWNPTAGLDRQRTRLR